MMETNRNLVLPLLHTHIELSPCAIASFLRLGGGVKAYRRRTRRRQRLLRKGTTATTTATTTAGLRYPLLHTSLSKPAACSLNPLISLG